MCFINRPQFQNRLGQHARPLSSQMIAVAASTHSLLKKDYKVGKKYDSHTVPCSVCIYERSFQSDNTGDSTFSIRSRCKAGELRTYPSNHPRSAYPTHTNFSDLSWHRQRRLWHIACAELPPGTKHRPIVVNGTRMLVASVPRH